MTDASEPDVGFNKVARRFGDDLSKPDYRVKTAKLTRVLDTMHAAGLPVRTDYARDWENSHILVQLDRLFPPPSPQRILDFGGGNSALCYCLAEDGHDVMVLDIDSTVITQVNQNAGRLGFGAKLRGVHYRGEGWPLEDAEFDAVVTISVFEGLLLRSRPLFWAEARRVMKPGAPLLMTFDYGLGARRVSDPPTTVREVEEQIVAPSGLRLVGRPLVEPDFDPGFGRPVKLPVWTIDGHDFEIAEYSFAALHFHKDPAAPLPAAPAPRVGPVYAPATALPSPPKVWAARVADWLMAELPRRVLAHPTIRSTDAVYQFELRDGQKGWQLRVTGGQADVREGTPGTPTSVISCTTEDMLRLVLGVDDLWALHYERTVRLRGDVRLIMRLTELFGEVAAQTP